MKINQTQYTILVCLNKKATNLNEMLVKTAQKLVSKAMRTKQARLAYQFQKIMQRIRRYSSLCYGKDDGHFVEDGHLEPLTRIFNNSVYHMMTFLPGDEPIKSVQNAILIQGKVS